MLAPTRFRQRVFAAGVVAVSLLTCSRAFAWGFDEHTELGSKGYKAACDQLAHDLNVDVQPRPAPPGAAGGVSDPCVHPKDDTSVRWCLACRAFSPALYGQSVAIAGDHVGSPDELWSPSGQIVATNVVDYTFLALVNVQHFHPAAPGTGGPSTTRRWSSRPRTSRAGRSRATSRRSSTRRPSRITSCRTRSRRGTPGSTDRRVARWRRKGFTTSGTRRAAW